LGNWFYLRFTIEMSWFTIYGFLSKALDFFSLRYCFNFALIPDL
jgi:hypothetical protein